MPHCRRLAFYYSYELSLSNEQNLGAFLKPYIETKLGKAFNSNIESFIESSEFNKLKSKIQLIFTSPPYILNAPKKYGNRTGSDYQEWLSKIFSDLIPLLNDNGSLVVELGNSWNKGSPTMSLLPLQTLMQIATDSNLHVCQQFIWHNPGKLPGPASYVNIKRERVTDSFTHLWWYSKNEYPKASNLNVLKPYGEGMKKLLKTKKYNAGLRPSGHNIKPKSFLGKNEGSIPSSVLSISNTGSDKEYRDWCVSKNLEQHPARMPMGVADFFIAFLTEKNDIVLDPFGGSCTTGKSAENLNRRWICTEPNKIYLNGAKGRFRKRN